MNKRALFAVLALLSSPAAAQDYFKAQATFGGAFTTPLTGPSNCTTTPAYSFTDSSTSGVGFTLATTTVCIVVSGTPALSAAAGGITIANSVGVNGALPSADTIAMKAPSGGFGFSLFPSGGGATAIAGVRQSIVSGGGHMFLRDSAGSVNTVEFIGDVTLGSTVAKISTLATNDDPTLRFAQGRIPTTDATVTTLQTIDIAASTTYNIDCTITARRTGGASGTAEDGANYNRVAAVKNVAGTATLIGTVATPITQEDQAAWDATIDVTAATARVRVTGAASNNVTWHSTCRVSPVGS